MLGVAGVSPGRSPGVGRPGSLLFSSFRHNFSFFPLLVVFSWKFDGVFDGQDP